MAWRKMRIGGHAFFWPLSFVLSACVAAPPAQMNTDLVRAWTHELSAEQPLPPPFLAEFTKGPKDLLFFAADHSSDGGSASLGLLSELFSSRVFDLVLLEGEPSASGLNPAELRAFALADGKDGFYKGEERSLAVQLAVKHGVPFAGAEPKEELIKNAVLKSGYSLSDLFGFYVVRQVPEWKRTGIFDKDNFDQAYARIRAKLGAELGLPSGELANTNDFRVWYLARNEKPFYLRDINSETPAPYVDGALFSQRISAVVGRARDQYIARVIEQSLKKYSRVLVVFGASHYLTQEPALASLLGPPFKISDRP